MDNFGIVGQRIFIFRCYFRSSPNRRRASSGPVLGEIVTPLQTYRARLIA